MKDALKKTVAILLLFCVGVLGGLRIIPKSSLNFLPSLIDEKELFSEKDQLFISIKPLSHEESEKFLKKDVLDMGYIPVQISIENQSGNFYSVRKDAISIKTVDVKKIASVSQKSSIPTSVGLKIAGFIFWPFSIPSMMHSVSSYQDYDQFRKDLEIKSLKEEIIPPYSLVTRVFFLKDKNAEEDSFSITLFNEDTYESKVFLIPGLREATLVAKVDPLVLPEENYYLTHES